MRASVAAIDAGVASLAMGALAAGAAIRLGWLGLGLARLRSIRAASQPARVLASMSASLQHELDVTAGTVWMTAVVLASGAVGAVDVVESLDAEHGLDQRAIDATRQWKFEPGTREGKPVAVEVTIEMTFTLK